MCGRGAEQDEPLWADTERGSAQMPVSDGCAEDILDDEWQRLSAGDGSIAWRRLYGLWLAHFDPIV